MNVTRDVIVDLLPLYLSGEVSADTRTLIEEFLEGDPELARLVRDTPESLLRAEAPVPIAPDHQMQTLQRTKRLVRRRGALLGLATFFTLMPFSFVMNRDGVTWMWTEQPVVAAVLVGCAATTWFAYLSLKRQLRVTGL